MRFQFPAPHSRVATGVAIYALLCSLASSTLAQPIEVDTSAWIGDSASTILGVGSIGLSVRDLDQVLEFYQAATGYPLIRRETVNESPAADQLYGRTGIVYEVAVLEAPNMLFELTAFAHNAERSPPRMPVQGPGMTHTCFQTASEHSGYRRFEAAGIDMLSRGESPVDLGGYGVTYAYGHDPEGNLLEMEQVDPAPLSTSQIKQRWLEQGHTMWMTQVALVTSDLERLTDWYRQVLAIAPYRVGEWTDHPRMVEITDQDGLSLRASWFAMAEDRVETIEIWQYLNPPTNQRDTKRDVTDFGYTYSLEVADLKREVERLKELGVQFIGEPVVLDGSWQVLAHDIDGNPFSLRQWQNPEAAHSARKSEQ